MRFSAHEYNLQLSGPVMIECRLLPPGSWMGLEMKSGVHRGKTALSEEEKLYTRLSFLVLFTFQCDPSVKQLTNPLWVDYTVAQLCWMHNIYSTIRVCALDYVLQVHRGNHRGTVLCITWLSWNENKALWLNKSLLQGSEHMKFPFQRLPTHKPLEQHKQSSTWYLLWERAREGRVREGERFRENIKRPGIIHVHITL